MIVLFMGKSSIIMANVYLLVSDLHDSYKQKENRYDYLKEIQFVKDKIIEKVLYYKECGYRVTVIFMGDIYNNSFKNITKGIIANNFMIYLRQICDEMYSVMGNHEFTYYTDNPFWTLIDTINSTKVESLRSRNWQPLGMFPVLNVVDKLEDGEVLFHFNHHGTAVNRPISDKINIGLFHQDITSKSILDDMRQNLGLEIFETNMTYFDNSSILYGYDYCFFGHMHKIYGHWTYTDDSSDSKTELYYLASLGRSNETEVNNKFLERNIPAIIIEDGKFIKVEDNKFNLPCREDCVKESVVSKNSEIYESRKEIKEVLKYDPIGDNPIENIRESLSDYPSVRAIFDIYLSGNTCNLDNEIDNCLEEIRWF